MNTKINVCSILIITLIFSPFGLAQQSPDFRTETTVDNYRVRHVVFNSTFVPSDVAAIHKLKRSKYESLLNVSVTPMQTDGSYPAIITGTVTNLMQQQKTLKFQEIREDKSTYYLAPVRVSNEELLHFSLTIKPESGGEPIHVKFSQMVYADE